VTDTVRDVRVRVSVLAQAFDAASAPDPANVPADDAVCKLR
jgi:hypothetical protein